MKNNYSLALVCFVEGMIAVALAESTNNYSILFGACVFVGTMIVDALLS